jgi:hypothetical protein
LNDREGPIFRGTIDELSASVSADDTDVRNLCVSTVKSLIGDANDPERTFAALSKAGIAFERNQRLAGIGPVLHLFDADVVNRLTAGAALKESARNVDHVPRGGALVDQGRAAASTKAAHRVRFLLSLSPTGFWVERHD